MESFKINDLILQSSKRQSSYIIDNIQVSKITCENFGNIEVFISDSYPNLSTVYFDCLDSNNQHITTISNNFIINLEPTNPVGVVSSWSLRYKNIDNSDNMHFDFNPIVNDNYQNLSRVALTTDNESYLSNNVYLFLYTQWNFGQDLAPTDTNYYKKHLGIRSIDITGIDV